MADAPGRIQLIGLSCSSSRHADHVVQPVLVAAMWACLLCAGTVLVVPVGANEFCPKGVVGTCSQLHGPGVT